MRPSSPSIPGETGYEAEPNDIELLPDAKGRDLEKRHWGGTVPPVFHATDLDPLGGVDVDGI